MPGKRSTDGDHEKPRKREPVYPEVVAMPKDDSRPDPAENDENASSRFESLAKRLLAVPKKEIDAARERGRASSQPSSRSARRK